MSRTSRKIRTSSSSSSRDTEADDIISDLPRDVIYEIWERLPLLDAARMCVLSHNWRDIWTSTPVLAFDAQFFTATFKHQLRECDTHKYCRIISKILFQHQGPILKFSLYVPPLRSCPDVAQWISYLSRNGLRDFTLFNSGTMPLDLSWRLFSSYDLENLKLYNCRVCPPPNFRGFPKLTSLELEKLSLTYYTFQNLIGTCPLLQNLVLKNITGMEHRQVVIDAPKLRYLTLDWAFESLQVKNCENLVSASICMQKLVNARPKASLGDLVKALANSSKLEKLCFRGHFCSVWFKYGNLRTTFQKLRNLELLSVHLSYLVDFASVISCMQSFPNIETLKISVIESTNLAEHVLHYDRHRTLDHLRCAKVGILTASRTELKLIEILLACSPVLQKLTVHTPLLVEESSRRRLLTKLNQFHRMSRNVKVLCPEAVVLSNNTVHMATSASSSDSSASSSDSSSSSSDSSSSDSRSD